MADAIDFYDEFIKISKFIAESEFQYQLFMLVW